MQCYLFAAICAMSAQNPLVSHLLAQNAPLAASRIAAPTSTEGAGALLGADAGVTTATRVAAGATPPAPGATSSVPRFSVRLEDVNIANDEASALALAEQLRGAATIGLDAEWRPDTEAGCNHAASLVQLALAAPDGKPILPYWLVDLEELKSPLSGEGGGGTTALDAALAHAFASPDVTLLGYGFQTDLDKIALRGGWSFTSHVRCLVDLRESCAAATTPQSGANGNGANGGYGGCGSNSGGNSGGKGPSVGQSSDRRCGSNGGSGGNSGGRGLSVGARI